MNINNYIDLLIIQGTPFCNINCSYCYLPDRSSTKKISFDTIDKIIERLQETAYLGKELTVVWHAGEPLVMPIRFYAETFKKLKDRLPSVKVNHAIQSNGLLINEEWCKLFIEYDVKLGLSIDGPEFLHDNYRVTRSGKGTHKKVLEKIKILEKNNIDYHVISVVTEETLSHPEEFFNFFLSLGINNLGINIEEIEGENAESSLNLDILDKINKFWSELFKLQYVHMDKLIIREFNSAFNKIIGNPLSKDNLVEETIPKSHLVEPLGIISIDADGNFSTFSPELLGQKDEKFKDFIFGNVYTDKFDSIFEKQNFQMAYNDIQQGIKMCEKTCEYFKFCGGGAPSNKFYENNTFASTETMFCNTSIKQPLEVVLEKLESDIHS